MDGAVGVITEALGGAIAEQGPLMWDNIKQLWRAFSLYPGTASIAPNLFQTLFGGAHHSSMVCTAGAPPNDLILFEILL